MKKVFLLGILVALSLAFVMHPPKNKDEKIVVVIDVGHGGKDLGNESGTVREADINLKIANMLLETKKKHRKEIDFVFTRKGDDYLDLHERIAFIDKHKADLFISIHCDAYTDPSLSGFQIYHPIKGDHIVNSKKMAKYLEEAIVKKKTPIAHKSTKPGNMFTITRAHCPAVLINFGFLTNTNDLTAVSSEEYQMAFAEAIIEAINTYNHKIINN